jgi:primary-amine oxidase
VVDATTREILRVDILPIGSKAVTKELNPYKIHPPNEYVPEAQDLRTDLKPLRVLQPEGVSFRIQQLGETGHMIEWQKWSFQVGFNQREGMVLYNVSL